MCGGPAAGGGPCSPCLGDVIATMHDGQSRCRQCALRLRSAQAACPDCARRPSPLTAVFPGFDYESPGDMLITRYKIELRYALAEPLADLVLRAPGLSTPGAPALPAGTVLVPIPSSRASLRRRGFNPAGELARALARRTCLPLRPHWLARGRDGPKQSTLTRAARVRVARDAYVCPAAIPPCTIALVDDVMTTGSTLHAAALALRAAGAASVIGLVAARAPADDGGVLAQYRLP
ncbi:Phosphoribosyltransferase domain-containing protein [Bordetella sputigena]